MKHTPKFVPIRFAEMYDRGLSHPMLGAFSLHSPDDGGICDNNYGVYGIIFSRLCSFERVGDDEPGG